MAHELSDRISLGGISMSRRTLLGAVLAAGIFGPMVTTGVGTARAAEGDPEEYEMPEGVGSTPWW